ncbi:MAG: DUF1194 domain-containing protein [Acetobacteraceae bacterium]|nr:DUF1194 domain-containing protein [Acetobacteraceae bacterium]
MRRRTLISIAAAALAAPARLAQAAAPGDAPVDLLLLLAVDVSRSMDEEEARLQREGYAAALLDPGVLRAIGDGPYGAIALAYLEWSGPEHQAVLLPWTRVTGPVDAAGCSARLRTAPLTIGTWTSISTALDRARQEIAAAPFAADRHVIDVSGDGVNNAGGAVEAARDRAVADGIVINGLPVMKGAPTGVMPGGSTVPLDEYYREQVAGGPGAFVIPAEDFHSFGQAIRRKLVMEIAARPGSVVPA